MLDTILEAGGTAVKKSLPHVTYILVGATANN